MLYCIHGIGSLVPGIEDVHFGTGVGLFERSAPMKRIVVLLVGLLAAAAQASADTKIGIVESFSGIVTIDAFGTGKYIAVITGDVLYTASVLKTGPDGRVSIDLQGTKREIPPGARIRIADIVSTGVKRGGLSWFAAVGRILRSFTAATEGQESDRVLGSRAGNAGQDEPIDWEQEATDAALALPQALKDIAAGSYNAALAKLSAAEGPADPALSWELLFWKGFCYFQTEDYGDALTNLSAARSLEGASKTAISKPANHATMLFQLGSSYFLLGQEGASIPVLDTYLAENPDGQYAPYATILLARALAATGDTRRARIVAADGAARYKGTDLEREFSSIAQ